MEQEKILDLYWARSEAAIIETEHTYGNYCFTIAFHILENTSDSEECVNDTYLAAWNTIPPKRPEKLAAYLGKITRNLALNRLESQNAKKRGQRQHTLALEELENCIPASNPPEQVIDQIQLAELLNRFLAELSPETRKIFMLRYWAFFSIKEISKLYHMKESCLKMSLLRTRNQLKTYLEKEGISL